MRGIQEYCPVVAKTGSPWEPGWVLSLHLHKGSDVTAAVYLSSDPVVGFGHWFSALAKVEPETMPRLWLLPFMQQSTAVTLLG